MEKSKEVKSMTRDMERVIALSDKLKALSHPHRLRIVQDLMAQARNVTTIQETLGIPQPSVSAHLAKLKTAGIIQGHRNGQEIFYEVVDNDSKDLIRSLFN
jgi:DNA-binding transcriptional ArsR family regulator